MTTTRLGIYAGLPVYPENWVESPFGDLVDINPETLSGSTPGDYAFRYIDLSSVDRGVIHWDSVQGTTFREAPSRARRRVRKDDVLFGTVRPSLQSHSYIKDEDGTPLVASTGFAVLRAGEKSVSRYIKHLIFSGQVTAQVRRLETGSNYPAVNEGDLSGVLVPRPDPLEQARIAEVLDTLDEAIRRTESISFKLQLARQGLVREVLTRGVDPNGELRPSHSEAPNLYKISGQVWVPKEWDVSRVGDQFEIQLGKMLDAQKNSGEMRPYIGNKAVQWDRIQISEAQFVALRRSEMDRFRLLPGDLLVCEGGEVGRAAIWDAPIEECYYQKALHRLRPLQSYRTRLMLEFLHYWMSNDCLSEFISKTSIAHLTQEKLASVPLLVPPPDEQDLMLSRLNDFRKRREVEEQQLAKLISIKSGLSSDLLTGRIRTCPQ